MKSQINVLRLLICCISLQHIKLVHQLLMSYGDLLCLHHAMYQSKV